jgi:hypothetical protein
MGDQDHIGENLRAYMQGFSPAVRDIFERFEFHALVFALNSKPPSSTCSQSRLNRPSTYSKNAAPP